MLLMSFLSYSNLKTIEHQISENNFDHAEVKNEINLIIKELVISTIIGILMAVFLSVLISKAILNPLNKFKKLFSKAALGDFTIEKWQNIVDIMAKEIRVTNALITRVTPPYIEVF